MDRLVLYHNENCSKSREVLAYLKDNKYAFDIINYLEVGLSIFEILDIAKTLDLTVDEMLRKKEEIYLNHNIEWSNNKIAASMVAKNPILLERPILIKKGIGIIVRPFDKIYSFLEE